MSNRSSYPTLDIGQNQLVERAECGKTRRFLPIKKGQTTSVTTPFDGVFIFKRRSGAVARRSKYMPHVGNKQLSKLCVNAKMI